MEKKVLEKAKLRVYLRIQIRKIRQILELRKLQVLCRLKKIWKNVDNQVYNIFWCERLSTDEQIRLCLTRIEVVL